MRKPYHQAGRKDFAVEREHAVRVRLCLPALLLTDVYCREVAAVLYTHVCMCECRQSLEMLANVSHGCANTEGKGVLISQVQKFEKYFALEWARVHPGGESEMPQTSLSLRQSACCCHILGHIA